jgi:hypothetical protein
VIDSLFWAELGFNIKLSKQKDKIFLKISPFWGAARGRTCRTPVRGEKPLFGLFPA